ncbi:uncharacterized protein LOC134219933 [Armigeres subalbatus]|uniref:uncharacterized protein LOC134219933 n=1 Tax=Armigeres subalbatus TaxID=124917 RepID=UPI002ED46415
MTISSERFDRANDDNIQQHDGEPYVWDDFEHLIGGTHLAWLVLIGLTLVLLIFLVTGFLLATAILMTTFYFFINEHQQQLQQLLAHQADTLLPELEFS